MKTLYGRFLVAAVALTCSAHQALASYQYTIGNGGLLSNFSVTVDSTTESGILVGGIRVDQTTGAPTPSGVPGYEHFTTVCLDLNGRLYLGNNYTFDKQVFAGQTGLNPKWGSPSSDGTAAYQAIENAAYLYAHQKASPTATDWAALQLAVWAALYNTDSTGKITGTRFKVNSDNYSGAWAEAQGLITALNSTGRGVDYVGSLLKPQDTNAQELLIGVTPVPETTTLLAGALLLLPFGASTFRLLRKKKTA